MIASACWWHSIEHMHSHEDRHRNGYSRLAGISALLAALALSGCVPPTDDSDTGGIDCEQYLDEQSCLAAGCAGMIQTFVVSDLGTCQTQSSSSVCVAGGDSVGQRHAYYRELDGATVFARTAECPAAVELQGEMPPGEGWTECTGAENDPPGCACLCSGGECPAEVELEAMLACGAESLCPDFDLNDESGSQASLDAATCFFDALIAATPGHLRAFGNFGDPQIEIQLWITGAGQVRRHDTGRDVSCIDCCGTTGPTLDLCAPASEAELQACKDAYLSGTSHACKDDFGLWFASCERSDPVCE